MVERLLINTFNTPGRFNLTILLLQAASSAILIYLPKKKRESWNPIKSAVTKPESISPQSLYQNDLLNWALKGIWTRQQRTDEGSLTLCIVSDIQQKQAQQAFNFKDLV